MKIKGFQDTIKWYDKHAQEYIAFSYATVQMDVIEKFIAMLPSAPKVLDVGCGPGRDAGIFFQKGVQVTGVDLSKELIKIAKRKSLSV